MTDQPPPELRCVYLEHQNKSGWRWVMKTVYGHWLAQQDVCDKQTWSDEEVQSAPEYKSTMKERIR